MVHVALMMLRSVYEFKHGDAPEHGTGRSVRDHAERVLRCRRCGHPVTTEQARRSVNGRHVHHLFNPAGILFEVGCFEAAPGCRFDGALTTEFTWFPGFAWRYALCGGCGSHLGWEYQGEAGGFAGLIVTELRLA